MTTIAAGQSGSYTFTELSNVTVSLDSGEHALVVVLSSAGDQLFSDRVSSTKTIGPFPTGAVLTVTADGAAVDYAASTAKADGNFASYTGKEAVSYATDPITGLDVLDAGSRGVLANSGVAKNRGSVAVIRSFGTPAAGGATGQREGQLVYNFASRPIAYRILIQNLEATPTTNIAATACGSTTLGSPTYVLPTGGTYVPQTWAGSATLANGPARVSATVPGTDATADIMTIGVPDRSDGAGFLLFVRVHPGTGNFSYCSTSNAVAGTVLNAESNAGRVGALVSSLRNSTTSCGAGNEANFNSAAIDAGTLVSANLQPLYLLEVWFENGQRFIYGPGDSITAGSQITSGVFSAPARGAYAAGYAFINDGISGQTTAQYLARALGYLANTSRAPTRIHYPAWSPNDYGAGTVTAALLLAAKGRLMQILDVASKNAMIEGVDVPTPWPWLPLDAPNDALRLSFRTWLLSLKHPKLNVIDVESTLGDGATPVRWKAGYSPDGTHMTDAGAAAYGALYLASTSGVA